MSDEQHGHAESEKKPAGHGGGGGHGGHGGGGHEEHEGAPEWLISFADNVALMMGFFVVLLALNMKPADAGGAAGDQNTAENGGASASSTAMLDWAISLREAFNNPVDVRNPRPEELPLVQRILQRQAQGDAREIAQAGREQNVLSLRRSEYIGLGGKILFETDTGVLNERGRTEVAELARRWRGLRSLLEIRGHVSAAEAFARPDHGMQLAYERAINVARLLADNGIGWDQLRVVACADNDRAVPQARDMASHQENQRVEIVQTDAVTGAATTTPVPPPDTPATSEPADSPGDAASEAVPHPAAEPAHAEAPAQSGHP